MERELEEEGIPDPYDRQGAEQPFGYTGYRYDDISGTYFAQAREYQPENGRFTAEDVIKGNGAIPETLNNYSYCQNGALSYVDLDGKSIGVAILVVTGLSLLLTGCAQEEYESIVQPIPSPTPTPTPIAIPQPTPASSPTADVSNDYIKVDDYEVAERKEFIEFMKYAESGGNYNGSLHDADQDNVAETIAYGHDTNQNNDKNLYIGKTLTEEEGEKLLIKDLEARIPWEWLRKVENGGFVNKRIYR